MRVDVLFLRIVEAHKGLDGLDHALGIADQISIGISRHQASRNAIQQPGQMKDFPVRAAHCAQAGCVGEDIGEAGIDGLLILALVHHDALCSNMIGLGNQCHGRSRHT